MGQTFPWWGKRGLRKEVATAQVEQARGLRQATVAGVHARIKSAFARYYPADAYRRLVEKNRYPDVTLMIAPSQYGR